MESFSWKPVTTFERELFTIIQSVEEKSIGTFFSFELLMLYMSFPRGFAYKVISGLVVHLHMTETVYL